MLKEAFNASSAATPTSQSFGVLVLEIAADLEPLADILNRHAITRTQWLQLRHTPVFVAALKEQVKAFQGLSNISARVKMKAQLITERLLDHMYDIATQPAYPPSSRVAAFGQIKSLTGMEKPEDTQPFRKFSLTINMASGRKVTENTVTLEAIAERDAADIDPSNTLLDDPTVGVEITEDPFEEEEFISASPISDDDTYTEPTTAPASVGDRTWNAFRPSPGPPLKHPAPDPPPDLSRHLPTTDDPIPARPSRPSALAVINRLRGV